MFVFIRNPWGIQLCNFRIAQHEERAGETRLIFTMDAFQMVQWIGSFTSAGLFGMSAIGPAGRCRPRTLS